MEEARGQRRERSRQARGVLQGHGQQPTELSDRTSTCSRSDVALGEVARALVDVPARGLLQEARVPQERATPIWIDSASTIFVATNRSAPKKSTWVRRKTEELNECYEQGESDPQKIDECDNFADPQTKYLVGKVWARHLHYTHNLEGEPPPVAAKSSKKVKLDDE